MLKVAERCNTPLGRLTEIAFRNPEAGPFTYYMDLDLNSDSLTKEDLLNEMRKKINITIGEKQRKFDYDSKDIKMFTYGGIFCDGLLKDSPGFLQSLKKSHVLHFVIRENRS